MGMFHHSFHLIVPGVCLTHFSLNNVHKGGLRQHHLIFIYPINTRFTCSPEFVCKFNAGANIRPDKVVELYVILSSKYSVYGHYISTTTVCVLCR